MNNGKERHWPEIDLSVRQRPEGLEILQGGRAYIARDWRLAGGVVAVIETALAHGLTCLIRNEHPKENMLLPSTKGADYIGFSRKRNGRWVFVLDYYSCLNRKKGTPRTLPFQLTFYITFKADLEKHGIPITAMGAANGRGVLVDVEHLGAAINACLPNYGLTGSYTGPRGGETTIEGFVYEGNLQARMLRYWSGCRFGRTLEVIDQEVAFNGNRLDILACDREAGHLVIIELKHPKAEPSVVAQLGRYLEEFRLTPQGNGRPLLGAVVAETIPDSTRQAALSSPWPISLFQARWTSDGVALSPVLEGCHLTTVREERPYADVWPTQRRARYSESRGMRRLAMDDDHIFSDDEAEEVIFLEDGDPSRPPSTGCLSVLCLLLGPCAWYVIRMVCA
jgi:hypothetical protein